MSGQGKASKPNVIGKEKKKARADPKEKSRTRAQRAGVVFPVDRINRRLREGKYADRIATSAPIYMASVLEYLATEVLWASGNAAKDNPKNRIMPRYLQLAIRNDKELCKLFSGVTFAQGVWCPTSILN